MTATAAPSANRQIARAAGTVMFAYALSQLLGLVRWMLMSRYFGTGNEADAFSAARQLSDVLFNLVAGGALASAFIPTLSEFLTREDREGAWRLASAVANLVTLILTVLVALSALFAPFIVRYFLAPGFSADKQALTVQLLRVVLPSAVIFGISGLVMGILNAHRSFWYPALASSLYWVGMIFGILFLRPSLGIFGPAWGAVLGSGMHLAIQLPGLLRLPGRRFVLTLGIKMAEVRQVIRLMGPRLFGVAVVQINVIVNTALASQMGTGPLYTIGLAFAIMTVPLFVLAQGIATASFPIFAGQVNAGKLDEMRGSLTSTLRGVIFLALPASVGLILLREPLVAAFFEHGAFTHASTLMVAWPLLWYSVGLVGHSLIEVIYRAFYALHNTKTPVLVGATAMGLNLVFSFLFSALFASIGWMPHGGLALANSLATLLEMGGALLLIRRRLGRLDDTSLVMGLTQAAAGSLLMALGIMGWLALSASQPVWLGLAVGVVLGAGIYALVMEAMRVPEIGDLIDALLRRAGLPARPPRPSRASQMRQRRGQ